MPGVALVSYPWIRTTCGTLQTGHSETRRAQRLPSQGSPIGFGVTVLSDMVFRPWSLEGKEIEARPLAMPAPDMEVGGIWRKDAELSVPAAALRDFLIHACSCYR